jgi:hypothetical protein
VFQGPEALENASCLSMVWTESSPSTLQPSREDPVTECQSSALLEVRQTLLCVHVRACFSGLTKRSDSFKRKEMPSMPLIAELAEFRTITLNLHSTLPHPRDHLSRGVNCRSCIRRQAALKSDHFTKRDPPKLLPCSQKIAIKYSDTL